MSFNTENSNPVKVLILCKIPSKLERPMIHLRKVGYQVQAFTSMKMAVTYLLKEKPKHIIISWNFNQNAKKFIRTFNQTFGVEAIPFVESADRQSSGQLTKSGFKDIILYPLTGEGTQRVLDRREGRLLKAKESAEFAMGSTSKIQIRVNPEDVPTEGEWEEMKQQAWFLVTSKKTKMFGKKNGRFVYYGEKKPERKQNGTWNIDTKKGKLEFEILNSTEELKQKESTDPLKQVNLTEEEAVQKLSTALGMGLEEIDNQVNLDEIELSEEPEAELDLTDENLKLGRVEEKNSEDNYGNVDTEEEDGGLIYQQRDNKKGDLIYQERAPESEQMEETEEGAKEKEGLNLIKGEKKKKGLSHIKGERKKSELIFQERDKEKNYGNTTQESGKDPSGGLIFQERQKVKGGLEIVKEKYEPRLEGLSSKFAKIVHSVCIEASHPSDEYPELVSEAGELGIVTIADENNNGYLLLAAKMSKKDKENFLKKITEKINIELKKENIQGREMQVTSMEIPTIDFIGWAKESAEFVSFFQNEDQEVAIAFIKSDQSLNEVSVSHAEDMVAVPATSIAGNQKLNFDLYLYFPINNKFILYVKNNDYVYEIQMNNMRKRKIEHVFIRNIHIPQYKIYCAKQFISLKISSAKKYIKAG